MSLPIIDGERDGGFCRELALDEPLVGTAPESVQRWILLEDGLPWGPKPPRNSSLPEPVQRWLLEQDARPGTRTVLIRRPGQGKGAARRLFMAESGPLPEQRRLLATIVDLDELPDLDDAALEARAEPWERPLWLVCTHGTRDRCCAKWGLPLWSTMQALDPEGVWQSAHLGGHRYAPVALALPVGLQWGRVELEEVPSLLRAVEAGDLAALTGLRGRCCYPRAVQAAEGLLRLEQGLVAGDALRLLAVREDADATEVRFAGPDGVALTIVVEQVDRPDLAGPASCGDQPTSRQVFRRRHG